MIFNVVPIFLSLACLACVLNKNIWIRLVAGVLGIVVLPLVYNSFSGAMREHERHGQLNSQVGWPYSHILELLSTLSKQGRTEELQQVILKLQENERDIFDAWLLQRGDDRFRNLVEELKQSHFHIGPLTNNITSSPQSSPTNK